MVFSGVQTADASSSAMPSCRYIIQLHKPPRPQRHRSSLNASVFAQASYCHVYLIPARFPMSNRHLARIACVLDLQRVNFFGATSRVYRAHPCSPRALSLLVIRTHCYARESRVPLRRCPVFRSRNPRFEATTDAISVYSSLFERTPRVLLCRACRKVYSIWFGVCLNALWPRQTSQDRFCTKLTDCECSFLKMKL